ncbi:MAG: hypothetical protein ABIM50_06785 [Novosphingobium sp.]
MSVGGTYTCVLKTPMGEKEGTLIIIPSEGGDSFTGSLTNDLMGSVAIENGEIYGDGLSCKMAISKPMRMNVECDAVVDGDVLNGMVEAGMFGSMKLSGRRTG